MKKALLIMTLLSLSSPVFATDCASSIQEMVKDRAPKNIEDPAEYYQVQSQVKDLCLPEAAPFLKGDALTIVGEIRDAVCTDGRSLSQQNACELNIISAIIRSGSK